MSYNPWRDLRSREHVTFAFDASARWLGGGFCAWRGRRTAIVLDPELGRAERNAALAHELVHDERRHPCGPPIPDALAQKEEAIVRDIAVERLVPRLALANFIRLVLDNDDPVTVELVAERFDVPTETAQRACNLLTERAVSRHPSGR